MSAIIEIGPGEALRLRPLLEGAFEAGYREAWTVAQCENALLLPGVFCLAATAGAAPVGFALLQQALDEAELLLLAVDPEARRQGIAKMLLTQALARVAARGGRRLFLEVRENNAAMYFYTVMGFRPIGRRVDYYRQVDGARVDAITMEIAVG